MAVAFTVNTTPSMGEWDIIDAYSTDVGTAQQLLADVAGNSYLVKSIVITMKDTDGRNVEIYNGATLSIGPVKPYNRPWSIRYESPMVFTGAINVKTETDRPIHITMCYRKFPTS